MLLNDWNLLSDLSPAFNCKQGRTITTMRNILIRAYHWRGRPLDQRKQTHLITTRMQNKSQHS